MKRIDCNRILSIATSLVFIAGALANVRAEAALSPLADHQSHTSVNWADDTINDKPAAATDDPWSAAELTEPAEFSKRVAGPNRPVILQIGVIHLYRLGHIPGSTFAGQAGSAEGIETLKKNVQAISRDREVVYYCGCCPWNDCPNIR